MMSGREIRAKQRYLHEENRKWSFTMTAVPFEQWPAAHREGGRIVGVWRSKRFLAQAFLETDGILRLTVCRTQLDDRGRWVDGITWDDLQRIKQECGFGARDAVEIFPADRDLVDVANMRHQWIFAEPFPLTWRAR